MWYLQQLATRWDGMPWKGSAPEVWTVEKTGVSILLLRFVFFVKTQRQLDGNASVVEGKS